MANGGVKLNPYTKYYEVASATVIAALQAVKAGPGRTIVPATAGTGNAGDEIIGFATMASADGETELVGVDVLRSSSNLVGRAGATITVGSDPVYLKTDADGELIPSTTGTDNRVGRALHTAASGDRVEVDPA